MMSLNNSDKKVEKKNNKEFIRVNRALKLNKNNTQWRTSQNSVKINIKSNDQRITTAPKLIRMQGRTAKEPRLSLVNRLVYVAHKIKDKDNNEIVHFEVKKCNNIIYDEKNDVMINCNGDVVYDEHESKVCSKCGLIYELINLSTLVIIHNDEERYSTRIESMKERNRSWDNMNFDDYLENTPESRKLQISIKRIRDYNKIK